MSVCEKTLILSSNALQYYLKERKTRLRLEESFEDR